MSRFRTDRLVLQAATLVLGLAIPWPAPEAWAHDFLEAYVQHRAQLSLGRDSLDLAIELTFFEDWSAKERARMDIDADGMISRIELRQYVDRLESDLQGAVALSVGGEPVDLVVLYKPEVELLGFEGIRDAHHRLRLVYFVRRPDGLKTGAELAVTDRLWPSAPTILSAQAKRQEGCRFELLSDQRGMAGTAAVSEPRIIRWRFLEEKGRVD